MTNEQPKPERPRIDLVFTAKCDTTDKKPAFIMREYLGDGRLGEAEYIFPTKKIHGSIGCIYSFEYEPPKPDQPLQPGKRFTSYYPTTQRYVGQWPNSEERALWQTLARGYDVERDAAREQKKAESANEMLNVLEPLRRRYAKTNAAGKLTLEVLVLAYLRRTPLGEME
jgi:hypothetical protein